MPCCQQKRTGRKTAAEPPRPPQPGSTGSGRSPLRFLGSGAIRIRGTASGRLYRITSAQPYLVVDAADEPALLRSGLFRR